MQRLDIKKTSKRTSLKIREVEPVFNSHYGSDDSLKAKWQALCQDCGIDPPLSIRKCEKVEFLLSRREILTFASID